MRYGSYRFLLYKKYPFLSNYRQCLAERGCFIQMVLYGMVALLISLFLYFPVKWFALSFQVIDQPSHDKIHLKPVPRIGGLAIFISFFLTVIFSPILWKDMSVIMLGAIAISLLGLMDDKWTLKPTQKLAGQVLVVLYVMLSSEIVIMKVAVPFLGIVPLGVFSYVVTFIWMIGIINAINLIDGLDGLAAGITIIALLCMLVMAIFEQQLQLVLICVILIGSIAGFIVYNIYPAKIYMGDTGSLFLGYMMAVIPLLGLFKQVTFFSFIIPVVILTIPIFDTLFVMIQRLRRRENIFHRDQKHLHYRLLKQGWTHKETVFIIYGFAICFGVMSIAIAIAGIPWKYYFIVGYFIIIGIFAHWIWKIPNKK